MRARAAFWIAALTLVLHAAIAGRYGWFRDEMYFLACGRRLAWGYVDQPPGIALISRLAYVLGGGRLWLYRMPSGIAHAAVVYLCGWFAAREGGSRLSVVTAALCAAAAPVMLVEGYLLTMNAFEPLCYLGLTLLVVQALRGSERAWLWAGALTGLALLNKHSFLFYALTLLAAAALTNGRALLSRWLAAGVAVAALIVLPHALWQVRHGFPMLELLAAQKTKNASFSTSHFLFNQLLLIGPVTFFLTVTGIFESWKRPALRPVGLAFLLQLALFIALKGKTYYLAAGYTPLFALGAIAVERLRWPVPALVAATGALVAPVVLPILSPEGLVRWQAALHIAPPQEERHEYGPLPQHLADEFGWPELSQAVQQVAAQLSPDERAHAGVYCQNYGEAGALELFGSGGLPVFSGHNAYWMWGPPPGLQTVVIVGGRLESHLRNLRECRQAGQETDAPYAMPYERARPIFVCTGLRAPIEQIWPKDKHYE
ncbi:MAG TPA: glycosyltransferase family 39 protein [Myxococcales bacterium]|nr:glycosyltransferase family 39 protein [Myxococcales bacterium]